MCALLFTLSISYCRSDQDLGQHLRKELGIWLRVVERGVVGWPDRAYGPGNAIKGSPKKMSPNAMKYFALPMFCCARQ